MNLPTTVTTDNLDNILLECLYKFSLLLQRTVDNHHNRFVQFFAHPCALSKFSNKYQCFKFELLPHNTAKFSFYLKAKPSAFLKEYTSKEGITSSKISRLLTRTCFIINSQDLLNMPLDFLILLFLSKLIYQQLQMQYPYQLYH